jgi:uncharacterized protein
VDRDYNETRETFLAFRVVVADSILDQLIGLLARRSLKADRGVWIVPGNAIHTIGMLFSFDVVMIDKDFRVVSAIEMVKPFRIILPKRRAESVIELPLHTIFRSRTQVGDQLMIERYEAEKIDGQQRRLVHAQVVSNGESPGESDALLTPHPPDSGIDVPKHPPLTIGTGLSDETKRGALQNGAGVRPDSK